MLVFLYVPPGVHSLELAGIREALFEANQRLTPDRQYDVRIVAAEAGAMLSASGLRFSTDHSIADAPGTADTLIVIGTYGIPEAAPGPVLAWLRQQAAGARRYGAVCTGAFLLCAAGLLKGRHATTHWQYTDDLASRCRDAHIVPDRIFIRDGPLFTSAGSSAAIDLTLCLVEEDYGRALALWVARRLVIFLKRPGGQAQFSTQLAAQAAHGSPIERVQQAVREDPGGKVGLENLASVAAMSPRNFSRVFRKQTGMSPADFVELTRIEIARGLLEEGDLPIQEVARRSGFSSAEGARRAFLRRLGLTPSEYRERFRSAGQG